PPWASSYSTKSGRFLTSAVPGARFHHRRSAWWSMASWLGSGMSSHTSCAQRQAAAILAAHPSASSSEDTSTIANPPTTSLASGYGPSVTIPSVATTLAFLLSSPAPKSHAPAFTASWTTSCAALFTAGISSSGMWSIAPASNEIRYRVIPRLLVLVRWPTSGRLSTVLRTPRLGSDTLPDEISRDPRLAAGLAKVPPLVTSVARGGILALLARNK